MPTEDKKNFFQNSMKDRMTYFNFSVAVKRHRDNYSCFFKMVEIFTTCYWTQFVKQKLVKSLFP